MTTSKLTKLLNHSGSFAVPAPRQTKKNRRLATIPYGSWPRRMTAETAAGYCGEPTVGAFIKRVGREYPHPRVNEGRRRLWLRDDLDAAILPFESAPVIDAAGDL